MDLYVFDIKEIFRIQINTKRKSLIIISMQHLSQVMNKYVGFKTRDIKCLENIIFLRLKNNPKNQSFNIPAEH